VSEDRRAGISLFGFTLIRTRELDALRAGTAQRKDETAEPDEKAEPAGMAEAPAGVVRELIRLADRLPNMPGTSAPAESAGTDTVVRWFGARVQAMLTACDVARIQDSGPVDSRRHEVVATRPAPGDDLAHHIADTVRPGYEWRGQLVRPQQVIAYASVRNPDQETAEMRRHEGN
jgi:hypothetical protein